MHKCVQSVESWDERKAVDERDDKTFGNCGISAVPAYGGATVRLFLHMYEGTLGQLQRRGTVTERTVCKARRVVEMLRAVGKVLSGQRYMAPSFAVFQRPAPGGQAETPVGWKAWGGCVAALMEANG